MNRRRLLLVLIGCAILGSAFSRADALSSPPGPDRYSVVVVEYDAFQWWMAKWKNSETVCELAIDHKGVPTPSEVYRDCGEKIYKTWMSQSPCNIGNVGGCEGYYIFAGKSWKDEKEIAMQLAPATAWISIEGCEAVPSVSTNVCETEPTLVVTGKEPLPNESIIRVEGTYNGKTFVCDGTDVCKFQIPETGEDGVKVEFWAFSSYGDSSVMFEAQVRVRKANEGDPDRLYWYADVLSSQWQGQSVATCADTWGVFPPVGGPPEWLTTPTESEELTSDIPYTYLAANLILQGVVDASACPDGGLAPGGGANQCGLEKARDAVTAWQNRFDELILQVAQDTGVPARLLKNLFARESQFWPGLFQTVSDTGLGQLTENGADTTLIWNPSFYNQFCPLVLSSERCAVGYVSLNDEEKKLLRQSLVGSVNATCEECPLGLDLSQADFSISVFAHTLIANCGQTGQVIRNYTGKEPGEVASYEDLWKFALVNYNAGGGCLADGISGAKALNLPITWENITPHLPPACQGAIDYVNDISGQNK